MPGIFQWDGQGENLEQDSVPTVVTSQRRGYNIYRIDRLPYMQRHG